MNSTRQISLVWIGLAAMLAAPVLAQESENKAAEVDTSRWKCSKCITYDGWVGTVDFGAAAVSEESVDFGRYNGLADNGLYPMVGSDLAHYGESGQVWELRAWDLGTRNGRLLLDGGTQGIYRFRMDYESARIWGADDTLTPFRGSGSETLSLPAGWVRSGSTAGMSALDAALIPLEIRHDRETLSVGVDLVASSAVEYGVEFRQQRRDGIKAFAGGVLFNGSQFAAPVDSTTDTLEANLSYAGSDWAGYFTYLGSFYSNEVDRIVWDNPFASGVGADTGRSALAPDNSFHQLSAAANFRFSDRSDLYGSLAVGRGEQDQAFLPYTTNTTLTVGNLPRTDLGGQVDTVTAVARYRLRPAPAWNLKADLRINDRYNETPQADYDYVRTDALLSPTSRTNLPYGFKDRDLGLSAEYRFERGARLAAGVDRESRERTYQAVEQTDETRLWAKARYRFGESSDLGLRLSRADRDATASASPPVITPSDNPLLTKYNTADRTRDAASLHLDTRPTERLGLGLGVGYSGDDYDETVLGLNEAEVRDRSVDLSYLLDGGWSLYGSYGFQEIRSTQVGNEGGGSANWVIDEEDTVETLTLGIAYEPPHVTTRFGLDIVQSLSHGRVQLRRSGVPEDFPLLKMAFQQARMHGVYALSPSFDLTGALVYELGNADDWALDGVEPDTVANVLALGSDSIDYKVWALFVGLRYRLNPPQE